MPNPEENRSGNSSRPRLAFYGGFTGALAPVALFLAGVTWLALSGAPDERGFWPVLLAALALGLALAKDREAWSDAVIGAIAQPIVAVMILAWMLAGVLGKILGDAGLVDGIVWLAQRAELGPVAFVGAAFLACAVVSTATGTSFGTILVAGPVLYASGGALGAPPGVLMGAVLAGATWGDSISPISDTTIASAGSQATDVAGTVRTRLRYAVPAGVIALFASLLLASRGEAAIVAATAPLEAAAASLPLLAVPVIVIAMLMRRRPLLEGLFAGIVLALGISLALGLLEFSEVLRIDRERFGATGLIVDGVNRSLGVTVFTILLMGLVGTVQASGLLDRLLERRASGALSATRTEWLSVGLVSVAVMLTTHSVVAVLAVGPVVRDLGVRAGLSAYRRANLLDLTVCIWPFLLPWFLPTILASGATNLGPDALLPRLSPFAIGMHNTYAWALLVAVPLAILTGYGRERAQP
jgi:Na+/H+ antiporter NhaC